jgi:YggT family protein
MNPFTLSLIYFFRIYEVLLIIQIFLSWVPHNYYHPLVRLLGTVTEPYLNLFRQLPVQYGGIDFSPLLAFFVLGFIRDLLFRILLIG